MSRRPPALAAGVGLAIVFVLAAFLAGRHSLLVRRPLLDGLAPPPPYRWISPPPALRSSNKQPSSGRFSVDLAPGTGSQANVFSTQDGQVSLAFAQGAIAAAPGASDALLTVTPVADTGFGPAPSGRAIVGNVYRVRAAYRPSGIVITSLGILGQLVIAYPAPPSFGYTHVVLFSETGVAWTALSSTDSAAQHLAQANISGLGYYAVGQSFSGPIKTGTPIGRIVETALAILLVVVVVGAIAVTELRIRRRKRMEPSARGSASREGGRREGGSKSRTKRPGPKPSKKIDPWE